MDATFFSSNFKCFDFSLTDSFIGEPRFLRLTNADIGFCAKGTWCSDLAAEGLIRCDGTLPSKDNEEELEAADGPNELPKFDVITDDEVFIVTIGDLRISNSNGSVSLNSYISGEEGLLAIVVLVCFCSLDAALALAYEVDDVDVELDGEDNDVDVDEDVPLISNLLISGKNLDPDDDEVAEDEDDVEEEVDEVEEGEQAAGGSTFNISLCPEGSINFLMECAIT